MIFLFDFTNANEFNPSASRGFSLYPIKKYTGGIGFRPD